MVKKILELGRCGHCAGRFQDEGGLERVASTLYSHWADRRAPKKLASWPCKIVEACQDGACEGFERLVQLDGTLVSVCSTRLPII